MSITVVTARDEYGAPTTREVYESAVKFVDDNGNLDIVSGKPQLLARYGSGNWMSVYVDDCVTVITTKPESGDDDDTFGSDFSFDSDDSDSDSDTDTDSDSDFSLDFGSDDSDSDSDTDSDSDDADSDDD